MTERGRELTMRGLVLGVLITFAFTAANVFLGLKVGLTFATSIPAAVISMALLRAIGGGTILENNIVQTVASAAGTLAAIAFVLPGLEMIGWWHGFPYLVTFAICATGGLLGVMFSIPLRRALVTGSDLPFPEGVAAAEVLKVGAGTTGGAEETRIGLRVLLASSIASGVFSLLVATRLFAGDVARWFRVGPAASGLSWQFSFALIGAGHLVGLSVGIAFLVGIVIAFGIATPVVTALHPAIGPAAQVAQDAWAGQVKFIGAGVIAVAALWSLARLLGPIVTGLREAAAASRARKVGGTILAIEERDIPIGIVGAITAALIVPIAALLFLFLREGPLAPLAGPLTAGAVVYVLVASLFVAAVCGYMAGLIGASNSPLSGVGILAIIGASLLLVLFAAPIAAADARNQLIAFAIFATAIVFAAATISNDNLQDLKTGQLVGAAPWAQQVALIVGVLAGAAVIPLVLDLLGRAYGFGSTGPDPLPAPQAMLITALAKGVLGHDLAWGLIGIGGAIGAALIAGDALLGRFGMIRVPPLAVGIGIYLPMEMTVPIVAGAVIGHLYEQRRPDAAARRLGVLTASGLIVGESLMGVAIAGLVVATGSGTPLAIVGDKFGEPSRWLATAAFSLVFWALYRETARSAARLRPA